MADALTLEARTALPGPLRYPSLTVTERPDQRLTSVMARRDDLLRVGIDAPGRPAWRDGWTATGPDRWLVAGREPPATLDGVAAIVDLSDAYACFTLRGPALRDVLAKGVTLDLDSFGPGSAAVTAIAHVGVILWCEESPDTFELAVTRSFVGSFLDWLEASARAVDSAVTRTRPRA